MPTAVNVTIRYRLQPSQQAFPLYGYIARARVIGMAAVAHQMAQAGRPVHEALIVARYVGK